jgi:phage shock protein A
MKKFVGKCVAFGEDFLRLPDKIADVIVEVTADELGKKRQELSDRRTKLSLIIKEQKYYKAQCEKEKEASLNWEQKAKRALNAGKEELAKGAIVKKLEFEKLATISDEIYNLKTRIVERLQKEFNECAKELDSLEHKKVFEEMGEEFTQARRVVPITDEEVELAIKLMRSEE